MVLTMTKVNTKKTRVQEYLNLPWHYSVEASDWEGEKGYWAWVSELPDCSTFDKSRVKALEAVANLLPEYLLAALESNANIPIPESGSVDAADLGGTIVLRIPKSLHLGIKQAAKAENTSLNQFALFALTKMVYQTNLPKQIKKR